MSSFVLEASEVTLEFGKTPDVQFYQRDNLIKLTMKTTMKDKPYVVRLEIKAFEYSTSVTEEEWQHSRMPVRTDPFTRFLRKLRDR